ncbi:NAD(P) transhydrogenase subunit alpha (plasmid) [Serratia marcescens]|nr:NAD(P) transhydrogenase subunit alpha [Serratia marcescens]
MDSTLLTMSWLLALYLLMLAAFTGYEVIGKVPSILHTPLMSGSNFIHGIVVVGAMHALINANSLAGQIVGFIGVALGAGYAAGGYVVTERMLAMFKPSEKKVADAAKESA